MKTLLKNMNLSYGKFAEALGLDISMISYVMKGDRNPGVKFFEGFLDFCSKHDLDPNKYIAFDTTSNYKVKVEETN